MIRRTHSRPSSFATHLFSLFAFTALLAFSSSVVRAQFGGIDLDPGDPGTGGKNTIEGHIFYPSGRTLDKRLHVLLTSVTSGRRTTMADDNGEFIFRRLSPGTYTVTVNAGEEFEPVTETVYILESPTLRTAFGRSFSVQIQLKYKESSLGKASVLDASLASVPKPALKLYQKALASAQNGDNRKAIEQLKQATEIYPQFTAALSELGYQYLRLNELERATDALQAALKLVPEAFAPRLTYGKVLILRGQFAEAETELRRAVKLNDTSPFAHFHLERALLSQNRYNDSEPELKRAIELSKDSISEAHRFLGAVYNERGDRPHAIEELETYLRMTPNAKDAAQIREIIKQFRAQASHGK